MTSTALLASRDFRLLLGGQLTTQLGTHLGGIALPLLAVVDLHASTFEVGLIAAASTLAFALIGLPAGAWLDRWPRRPVLVASDVVRALVYATIPVAAWLGVLTVAQLVIVAFLAGIGRVFFDVGYQSYLPTVVGRDRLLAGNSGMELMRSAGQIAGPALGGFLVALWGAANVLLAQAASFAVSAATLLGIRAHESPADPDARAGALWHRVGEGIRFVAGDRVLRATAIASAACNLSFAIASAVTIVFLARDLGQPAWVIGLIISPGAIAVAIGAAATPRAARRIGSARIVWFSLAVTAPLSLLVVFATPGWGLLFAVAGFAIGELGQIVYAITNVSLRQRICPDRILARVNATMRFAIMALFPLGAILGGVLGELIGTRWTLLVAGVVALAAPFVVFRALRGRRDVEELHDGGMDGA
jgi:MFS family permease